MWKTIELPEVNGKIHTIAGGPYSHRPDDVYGVKLAVEIPAPCKIDLPVADFSVPDEDQLRVALSRTIIQLYKGKNIYVGCMGGIGRTGLFLSCLLDIFNSCGDDMRGGFDPILEVRKLYKSNAVETAEQQKYVLGFDNAYCKQVLSDLSEHIWLKYLPEKWILWLC